MHIFFQLFFKSYYSYFKLFLMLIIIITIHHIDVAPFHCMVYLDEAIVIIVRT